MLKITGRLPFVDLLEIKVQPSYSGTSRFSVGSSPLRVFGLNILLLLLLLLFIRADNNKVK